MVMSQTSENRTKSKIPRRRLNVGSVSISHFGTDFLRALDLRGGTRGANWGGKVGGRRKMRRGQTSRFCPNLQLGVAFICFLYLNSK